MATSTPDTSEIRRRGRQRLIGAVTIVLLLVVFVPMLLDPEPRQDRKEPAAVAIPAKEGAPALPVPAAIPPKPQLADATKSSRPPSVPEGPKVEAPPVTPAKAAAPKADPLSEVIAAKTAEPAAATPAKAAPQTPAPLVGFAVQVGAFRDDDKLRQAREKLAAAKITHFTEHLPNSDLTRLRAGPYKTREEADKAAATIKTAGLDGKVVPLP